jgi:hypothetical protein
MKAGKLTQPVASPIDRATGELATREPELVSVGATQPVGVLEEVS